MTFLFFLFPPTGEFVYFQNYFTPLYEAVTEGGVTKNYHYLTAANGLFAIFVTSSNGEEAMYYTMKDHQGSLAAVIHPDGDVEHLSYDAWGRRRNADGFGYDNLSAPTCLTLKKVESKREEVAVT